MNALEIFERINNARDKANRSKDEKIYFTAVSKTRTIQEMQEVEKFSGSIPVLLDSPEVFTSIKIFIVRPDSAATLLILAAISTESTESI